MRFERTAALGALGVAAAIFLVYLLFCFLMRPQAVTSGMDWTNAVVTWISTGILALALIATHVALAWQLWKGEQVRP